MFCKKCGQELHEQANFCPKCGLDVRVSTAGFKDSIPNTPVSQKAQPAKKEKNAFSIVGFVLSLIVFISAAVSIPSVFIRTKAPDTNIVILILSAVFSVMGLKSKKKGFSVAGIIITVAATVLIVVLYLYILVVELSGTNLYNFFGNHLYY